MQDKSKKIVGVQLPDCLIEPLEKEAEEYGFTISAMIRLILSQRYRGVKIREEEK